MKLKVTESKKNRVRPCYSLFLFKLDEDDLERFFQTDSTLGIFLNKAASRKYMKVESEMTRSHRDAVVGYENTPFLPACSNLSLQSAALEKRNSLYLPG